MAARLAFRSIGASQRLLPAPITVSPLACLCRVKIERAPLISQSNIHTSPSFNNRYRRFGDGPSTEEYPSGYNSQSQQTTPLWKRVAIQQNPRIRRNGGTFGGGGKRFDPFSRVGIALIALVGGGIFYVFHLEKVPDTGRWRFMVISVDQERKTADQAFNQILEEYRGNILPSNDPIHQYVLGIASKIINAASIQRQEGNISGNHLSDSLHHGIQHHSSNPSFNGKNQIKWQVFVVKDDTPNAFVLPNGKIFVNTGILPICKDQDGLATVLGHEVAHQLVRHSAEKMSSSYLYVILGFAIESLIGLDFGISSSAFQILMGLPNSRSCESEADHIGLRLMSSACFDPNKAPSVWERMQKMEKSQKGGGIDSSIFGALLSTHPTSANREIKMKEWIPEANQIRQNSNCPASATISSFKESIPVLSNPSTGLFSIGRA